MAHAPSALQAKSRVDSVTAMYRKKGYIYIIGYTVLIPSGKKLNLCTI